MAPYGRKAPLNTGTKRLPLTEDILRRHNLLYPEEQTKNDHIERYIAEQRELVFANLLIEGKELLAKKEDSVEVCVVENTHVATEKEKEAYRDADPKQDPTVAPLFRRRSKIVENLKDKDGRVRRIIPKKSRRGSKTPKRTSAQAILLSDERPKSRRRPNPETESSKDEEQKNDKENQSPSVSKSSLPPPADGFFGKVRDSQRKGKESKARHSKASATRICKVPSKGSLRGKEAEDTIMTGVDPLLRRLSLKPKSSGLNLHMSKLGIFNKGVRGRNKATLPTASVPYFSETRFLEGSSGNDDDVLENAVNERADKIARRETFPQVKTSKYFTIKKVVKETTSPRQQSLGNDSIIDGIREEETETIVSVPSSKKDCGDHISKGEQGLNMHSKALQHGQIVEGESKGNEMTDSNLAIFPDDSISQIVLSSLAKEVAEKQKEAAPGEFHGTPKRTIGNRGKKSEDRLDAILGDINEFMGGAEQEVACHPRRLTSFQTARYTNTDFGESIQEYDIGDDKRTNHCNHNLRNEESPRFDEPFAKEQFSWPEKPKNPFNYNVTVHYEPLEDVLDCPLESLELDTEGRHHTKELGEPRDYLPVRRTADQGFNLEFSSSEIGDPRQDSERQFESHIAISRETSRPREFTWLPHKLY